jgi:hypothetical protein
VHVCICMHLYIYACNMCFCILLPAGVPKSPTNAGLQSEVSFTMRSSFESLFSDVLLESLNSREVHDK